MTELCEAPPTNPTPLREERDASFWDAVAAHPAVAPGVFLGADPVSFAGVLALPTTVPFAGEHGGLVFLQMDGLGRVFEMHTLFTPEGHGREAATSMREATAAMFRRGAQLLVTYQIEERKWTSGPPRSHGWRQADDFARCSLGVGLRSWSLSAADWRQSPAFQRMA